MHDFRYVEKEIAKPLMNDLKNMLHEVQDFVRVDFTFNFYPVGSYKRNMVTYDAKSNVGFDFDINIEVNDKDENYSAEEIRNILRNAINKVAWKYGYKHCEDSTRVLTIKKVNTLTSRIIHSCDFAIVNNCNDGRQQYIRFNKENRYYSWEYQGKGFENLEKKYKWLKNNGFTKELRDYYIDKKNLNNDPDKHSRSIFAETVNELCQKKGYRNR